MEINVALRALQLAAQIDRICDRLVELSGAQGAAHSGGYARVRQDA